MLGEELSRALCDISDEKIADAAEFSPKPQRSVWLRLSPAAAVVLLLLGMWLLLEKPTESGDKCSYFAIYALAGEVEGQYTSVGENNVPEKKIKELIQQYAANYPEHQELLQNLAQFLFGSGHRQEWESPGFAVWIQLNDASKGYREFEVLLDGEEIDLKKNKIGFVLETAAGELHGLCITGAIEDNARLEIVLHDTKGVVLQRDIVEISIANDGSYYMEVIEHYVTAGP